jgi:phage tail sheath protein FI
VAELLAVGTDTVRLIRPEATIARAATAVTAFVGRALKGPVNEPIRIQSFDEYQRVFGGLWQPSTMSYALEQFFENGGCEALVVRVCNGGRPPSLTLPAGDGTLRLAGLAPGTREFLRVAIDYDGIPPGERERFNMVVQRLRAPGSEFIEDQEIYRRVSVRADAERSLAQALSESRLVRVTGALPERRPDASLRTGTRASTGYVLSHADGDDGDPLTIYDLIGERASRTGLFALRGEAFNFLCLPPLTREAEVGLPALLVALRLCREQQAMLLLDPPAAWTGSEAALAGLRTWPLFSENAVMFFPRVQAMDRLRGREELFGPAAAAAGLIARIDQSFPVWAGVDGESAPMRAGLRLALSVNDLDRIRLAHAGVNVLGAARPAARHRPPWRTLTAEAGVKAQWRSLSERRFALFVMRSIERGTRWVVFERQGPALWQRLRAQVTAFFEALATEGAFAGRTARQSYFVICDGRLNEGLDGQLPEAVPASAARHLLLFGFAATRPGEFQTCLVTHRPDGSTVRPVSVNWYALLPRS